MAAVPAPAAMPGSSPPEALGCIRDRGAAAALLHPLRLSVLSQAGEPVSASEIGRRLSLPRQKVNYHVRALVDAGLLRPYDRRRRRNLYEQRYLATARSYVVSPEVLGPLAGGRTPVEDQASAAALLALTGRTQAEVGRVMSEADAAGQRVSTLSLMAELRFTDAAQRAAFAEALTAAVTDVVAKHTAPFRDEQGEPGAGRPYRLVLGCHPIPPDEPAASPAPPHSAEPAPLHEDPTP